LHTAPERRGIPIWCKVAEYRDSKNVISSEWIIVPEYLSIKLIVLEKLHT
jgi:hypothetical protein